MDIRTLLFCLSCVAGSCGLLPAAATGGVVEPSSGFELGRVLGNLYGKALYCGLDSKAEIGFERRAITAIDRWARDRRDRFEGVKEFTVRAATGFKYGPKWVNGETCPGVMRAFSAYRDWLGK